MIGFVLPINCNNGLPIPFAYPANNFEDIRKPFKDDIPISSFINVIMAKPLSNDAAFCLVLFGSNGRYTSGDVTNRWKWIVSELLKCEINVLSISSDSDPKYNAAMRDLSQLGSCNNLVNWFR